MGWLMATATGATSPPQLIAQSPQITTSGPVDPVPSRYQLGQELYLENCATCHIAIPPQVFPTETWRQLLQDPQHYGQKLRLLVDPPRILVWNYLRAFSRSQPKDEEVPYRVTNSRYFQALHPRVKLPPSTSLSSCVTCHPGTAQYDFRQLTPEWANSP